MEDDVILPDDFEAQPQADEVAETEVTEEEVSAESVEDTKPTEEVSTEPQTIKIKYNHQEQDIPYDDAIPLIQKGMNFDKAVERAKQEARDAYIAEQGMSWNGKPITTEEEYNQAIFEQQLIEKYQNRDLPDDVVQELVESRKFREEAKREREARAKEEQEKAQQEREVNDFVQTYPNVKFDEIPKEVWELHAQGTPLKFAYMQHEYSQLQNQVKILKQNQENQKKAPVQGITSHGSDEVASTDPFLIGFDSI